MPTRPQAAAKPKPTPRRTVGTTSTNRLSEVVDQKSPRTILLAVSGMSPAILTETVWALAKEKPPVIPDDVVVITTTKGASDISAQLLAERSEWGGVSPWSALRRAILGAKAESDPRLQFSAPRVIELPDAKRGIKHPADDLRTPADNAAAADFLLEEVRRLTENPDTHVVASIAGGRKTMGALLYAAMSLLGRETDRLTHVLVSDPYEQCRDFFFPGQLVKEIATRDGRKLCAADARIDLADIPFVPLRNLFERDLSRRPGSFAALVAEASKQIALAPPKKVRILTDQPKISIDGTEVRFSPREHVLVLLLARECVEGRPPYPDHPRAHASYQQLADKLRAKADSGNFRDWHSDIPKNSDSEDIRKMVSSIREKLKAAGPDGRVLEKSLVSRGCLGFQSGTAFVCG